MTTSRSFPVFTIVFAVVYAVAYVIAVEQNYALFTYHPAIEEFGFLVERPREGPAMYWYGWMATAGIIALVAGVIACLVPEQMTTIVVRLVVGGPSGGAVRFRLSS